MKNQLLLCLLFIGLLSGTSFAQKTYVIKLNPDYINIPNRSFYIDQVIDNRTDKSRIGIVHNGTQRLAQFEYGLENSLEGYLKSAFPTTTQEIPIVMVINRLEISEKPANVGEVGYADISVDFFTGEIKLFSTDQHVEVTGNDVTKLHEANIREAVAKTLFAFDDSNWVSVMHGKTEKPQPSRNTVPGSEAALYSVTQPVSGDNPNYKASESKTNSVSQAPAESQEEATTETYTENRNITAVGYQIGGITLIGVDYEIRASDYFGIHLGGGLAGFTAGMKIHTNPEKNSSFFNFSYKDGGFGQITTLGLEFGGRLVFSKSSDLGLVTQIGIQKILSIDEEFEKQVFKGNGAPPVMLAFGIGLSW
ncbi:hypothetical protein RT717_17330 [Imperialibacter roseus]|uniref:Curli production assembly/transport component CsgG n=1 Tax=Imperialibacter roseus TaxID=1324217 RepID=A0ABZ0III3_9BACT|nr:hypothetical protein [Imperialibacter roseus]WOK04847.1 hypothetical protein RT717_17330 [Imperialibacter roseus]